VSTDSEVIERSLSDPAAFSHIFERHARTVSAFASRWVGDAADDVLSEPFLTAFKRRGSFDRTRQSCLPWLLGIASKLVRRHRAAEARQWRSVEAAANHGDRVSRPHDIDADARLDAAAAVGELKARIAGLTAADRQTLLLYAWGDLSYDEVAEALRIPVGTVRSRLNRVRRKLDPARAARPETDDQKGDRDGLHAVRA